MMFKGIDTAATITPEAARKLKELGYSFVGRYTVPVQSGLVWKALKSDEAKNILDAGLAILPIWETTATRAMSGINAGVTDGAAALKRAVELGIPSGSVICFAVDFDAQQKDVAAIEAYLRGAKWNIEQYKLGLYAPVYILEKMKDFIDYGWQCYAWAYGKKAQANAYQTAWQEDPAAKALQRQIGFAVDLDEAESLEGMWMNRDLGEEAVRWAKRFDIIIDDTPNMKEIALMLWRYHNVFGPEDNKY